MRRLALYKELFAYECDCNSKMLSMINSVPVENRGDARFQQSITIADHIVACRINWLSRMTGDGQPKTSWYDENAKLDGLDAKFTVMQSDWTTFLEGLTNDELETEFYFSFRDGSSGRLNYDVQINQMHVHACYHRGQVAILVDQLGGEVVDTDYLYRVMVLSERFGKIEKWSPTNMSRGQ